MYNLKQYEMALSSFNQARSALVNLNASGHYQRQDTDSLLYNQLRDEVNKALLSERISDCHVQKRSRALMYNEMSVNYVDVINQLIEAKTTLELEIEKYCHEVGHEKEDDASIDAFATESNEDISEFKELLKSIDESLVSLFSCVCFSIHYAHFDLLIANDR